MSAGTYFGKYFLIKRIAQGGMGEIYIARQSGPGGFSKTVALKKVLPHLTENKEFIQGFLGEAALAAKMTHRNIVSVFDFGLDEESNSYFLTMEYVAGKALNQILEECVKRKERVPLGMIKDVSVQMCEGMSYAHNLCDDMGQPLNLVHRDLNPSNLLLSYNGDVKIIDWGIAKSEMSQVKTEAGMIKGKFVYMSPEQSMAKKLDKRSDVFAAGITIYEMLTGENPFHKPNVVLSLEAIQRLDPPPPSEFDPALAGFDPIVAKALAKDREKRYQDCGDIAEDLKNVIVPPAGERLGQFVGRLFRSSLEDEQKLMQETGAARLPPKSVPGARVPSVPGARVPSNPGARVVSSPGARVPQPLPAAADEERGGTLVMGGDAGSQEELRRQMDAARQKLAQQQAQAAAPRRAPVQVPEPEPVQRTMFIGAADLQPPPPKSSKTGLVLGIAAGVAVGVVGVGAFFFLQKKGAEPTPAVAAPVAVAPMAVKINPAGAGNGLPSPTTPAPPATARANPGQVAAENAKDEAKPPVTPPGGHGDLAENHDATKEDIEHAAAAKKEKEEQEKKEAASKEHERPPEQGAKTPEPVKVAAATPVAGLLLRAMPAMPIRLDGKSLDAAPPRIDLKSASGTLRIGDGTSPLQITINYKISGSTMTAEVNTKPWSLLWVNDGSRGKTPQSVELSQGAQGLVKLEFKRPGMDGTPRLIMKFLKE